MATQEPASFDTAALAAAVDARRRAGGLTWRVVADEVGVSASTMTRAGKSRGTMGADGALWMCGWLGRHPESFLRPPRPLPPGPAFPTHARVDTWRFYAALDERRRARGLGWSDVAAEVGGTPGMLTAMAGPPSPRDRGRQGLGPRMGIQGLMTLLRWLEAPAVDFVQSKPPRRTA